MANTLARSVLSIVLQTQCGHITEDIIACNINCEVISAAKAGRKERMRLGSIAKRLLFYGTLLRLV